MSDRVLLLVSIAAVAGLALLAAAAGRNRGAGRRLVGSLLVGLLLLYGAAMAWGWVRRASDFDRSTRSHATNHQESTR